MEIKKKESVCCDEETGTCGYCSFEDAIKVDNLKVTGEEDNGR